MVIVAHVSDIAYSCPVTLYNRGIQINIEPCGQRPHGLHQTLS